MAAQQANLGTIAALLFAADHEQINLSPQVVNIVARGCYHESLRTALQAASTRNVLRKMLGSWVKRSDNVMGYHSLALAMRYELKEGLVPAIKYLRNPGDPPHLRQSAILVISKLGDESHLALLEKLLDDKSLCASQRINNVTFETQIRDVALAAILTIKKLNPKEFGFERLQMDAAGVVSPGTAGFDNDDKRRAALAKWRQTQTGVKP